MMNQDLRERLFGHIRENAQSKGIILDRCNGMIDHIHILIRLKPDQLLAKVVQLIKGESSHWVNKNNLTRFHFEWQDEYIAVSVSESAVAIIRDYIRNQEEHHRKQGFREEYEEHLKTHGFNDGGLKPE
jgi:REP element-mobilizing transposase RayT